MILSTRAQTVVGNDLMERYCYLDDIIAGPTGLTLWHSRDNTTAMYRDWFALPVSCTNPEAVIRWYDYCNSSFELKMNTSYGEEGVYWTQGENGWSYGPHVSGMEGSLNWTVNFGSTGSFFFTPEEIAKYDFPLWGDDYVKKIDWIENARVIDALNRPNQFFPNIYEDPEVTRSRTDLGMDIEPYIAEFIATGVMNGVSDAQWDAHLKALRSMDAEEWVEMHRVFYDTYSVWAK